MRSPRDSGLSEQMEKRDCCYELMDELNCAKIALRMSLPKPEEVEHGHEEYELAEELPDPPQMADSADPTVALRFSGMYLKLDDIILHFKFLTPAGPTSQCLYIRGAGPLRLGGRCCQGAGVQCG